LTRAEWIEMAVQRHDFERMAEVGVQAGRMVGHLLEHCPRLHVTAVDLWAPQPERPEPASRHDDYRHEHNERIVRALERKYADRCRVLKGRSMEMARHVPDGGLDLVFIDADHAQDAVEADMAAWGPKVRPGGWLAGHDRSLPGVAAALRRVLPHYMPGPDDCWRVTV